MIMMIPILVFETRSHLKTQSRPLTRNLPGLAPPPQESGLEVHVTTVYYIFRNVFLYVCVCSVWYVWVLCEGARTLGHMCGCQRTISGVDSQSFILCETCLLVAFPCVYWDGLELPGASPFSTFHVPKEVLGLQARDTTFGFHWVPGICSQASRLYQCPVSRPWNILMSFCQDPLSQLLSFFFFVCAVIEVSSYTYLLGCLTLPPWALVVFTQFSMSKQTISSSEQAFSSGVFLNKILSEPGMGVIVSDFTPPDKPDILEVPPTST